MVRADTTGELQGVEPIIITSSPLILSSSQQMAHLAQAVDLQPDFLKKAKMVCERSSQVCYQTHLRGQ